MEDSVLSPTLVDSLTALVEFRNLLVYEHTAVDDTMVYGFAKKRLDDLSAFARVAHAYLLQSANSRLVDTGGSDLVPGSS